MADFSTGLQEAWAVGGPHFRFSGAILTEIRTLAEALQLAHKGSPIEVRRRRDESKRHE
ncbi:methyltransferase [Rhizobium phaseoli]|nr:methyltransferase [Rhizobium phaseoli]